MTLTKTILVHAIMSRPILYKSKVVVEALTKSEGNQHNYHDVWREDRLQELSLEDLQNLYNEVVA